MGRWIVDNRVRYQRKVFVAVGEALVLLGGRRLLRHGWNGWDRPRLACCAGKARVGSTLAPM
jgi:hypothetical protein